MADSKVTDAKPDDVPKKGEMLEKYGHKDFTMHDVTKEEREKSRINRFGNQYYPVDESYDKRVYENTPLNWVKIILALMTFWFFQSLHWWGVFCFGIANATALMYYSIIIFCYTIIFGIFLLISGKYANAKKREHEFLKSKIQDFKNEEQDKATREKQDRDYREKRAKHQAEIDRLNQEEAEKIKDQPDDAGAPTISAPLIVTNI